MAGGTISGLGEMGRGAGDFKAHFQNMIFGLNPQRTKTKKTVITESQQYLCLLRGQLGRLKNTNHVRGCLCAAVWGCRMP